MRAKTLKQRMREQMAARARRIEELRRNGTSAKDIAKLHGLTRARVYQILKEAAQ
jgi:predicted transcriptional regulator